MTGAREEILGRIRDALGDVPAAETPEDVAVARDYRRSGARTREQLVEHLAERVADYAAEVRVVAVGELAGAVTAACAEMGLGHVVVPPALPAAWRPSDVQLTEDAGLSAQELDAVPGKPFNDFVLEPRLHRIGFAIDGFVHSNFVDHCRTPFERGR